MRPLFFRSRRSRPHPSGRYWWVPLWKVPRPVPRPFCCLDCLFAVMTRCNCVSAMLFNAGTRAGEQMCVYVLWAGLRMLIVRACVRDDYTMHLSAWEGVAFVAEMIKRRHI